MKVVLVNPSFRRPSFTHPPHAPTSLPACLQNSRTLPTYRLRLNHLRNMLTHTPGPSPNSPNPSPTLPLRAPVRRPLVSLLLLVTVVVVVVVRIPMYVDLNVERFPARQCARLLIMIIEPLVRASGLLGCVCVCFLFEKEGRFQTSVSVLSHVNVQTVMPKLRSLSF